MTSKITSPFAATFFSWMRPGRDRAEAEFALDPPAAFLTKGGGRIVHPPQHDFDRHDPEGERRANQGRIAPATAQHDDEIAEQKKDKGHFIENEMTVRLDEFIARPRKRGGDNEGAGNLEATFQIGHGASNPDRGPPVAGPAPV
ncbi:hypothetical protein WOB59_08005 [Methylocystis sp. IM4]|uniref:hypothetical protein n=1 Tax=Methylocystis sp. IM4 TaxID=3136560 RepID=UPI003119AC67